MNAQMIKELIENPRRNPLSGRAIQPSGPVYQSLVHQSLATVKSELMKELFTVWKHDSIDTSVDIRIEPIPSNLEEVFPLDAEKNALVREKREMKKNALYIRIDEEDANIIVYLDEDEVDMPIDIIHRFRAIDRDDYEPFRREEDASLRQLLAQFSDMMDKLIKPNTDSIVKVYLEAIPSYRAADDFGKTVLRDVYGMYMIYLGLEHKQVRITEYEYDNEDGEYYKKNIVFKPPKAT